MASCRQAGATCQVSVPQHIADGTVSLSRAPRAGSVCRDDSALLIDYGRRLSYVDRAWTLSTAYAPKAIVKHAGADFAKLVQDLVPSLLYALGGVLLTTIVGAAVGAAVGSLGAGVGAAPGAVAGAEVGLAVGLWMLEWLGLGFLAVYLGSALVEIVRHFKRGVTTAWESCGDPLNIQAAAAEMADGVGRFFSLVFQGIVAYAAQQGMAVALQRLSASKIGRGMSTFLKSAAFEERTITYYLERLGRPREPALVRQRVGVAIRFLRDDAKLGSDAILELLKGIDFSSPVEVCAANTFKVGDILISNVTGAAGRWRYGNWFTKAGFSTDSVGIAKGNRAYHRFQVVKPIPSLKSRSAAIVDTWTPGRTRDVTAPGGQAGEFVGGGGDQYFLPKPNNSTTFDGVLKDLDE